MTDIVGGVFNLVTSLLPKVYDPKKDVKFLLYTRKNPTESQRIILNDETSLKKSNFNVTNPTRLLIHGWDTSNPAGADMNLLGTMGRQAYLSAGDFNVVVVDWMACAQTINYLAACAGVEGTGRVVGDFMDFLKLSGSASLSSFSIIGHSLGAHVAGFAGKSVASSVKLGSIVGLDAALPLFSVSDETKRLALTDANFVQCIHTDAGLAGFADPIGHVDIYPNWGKNQPGCTSPLTSCNHLRSIYYFTESIIRPNAFWSTKCADYDAIKNKKCPSAGSGTAMGGEPIDNKADYGVYFVATNSESLYGRGV